MTAKKQESPSLLRQKWLEQLVTDLRPWFKKAGYEIPANVRVSIGWPRGSHGRGKAIGQCWDALASTDKHHEVFVSPALLDSGTIIGVMAHELVHATVGTKAGHKGPFKTVALAVGLEGKMTATTSGAALVSWSKDFVREHGKYPGGALNDATRKKQGTRLIKCECPECGYVARVTAKWLDSAGAPICPTDQISMGGDDEDEGDGE
jgi:hypothetical protein